MAAGYYKKLVLQSLTAIILLLIAIGCFVFIIDPYQQYHASDGYTGNQRCEIGGVARNHDYDAFFTGSSMAMNHYPEQVDSLWGWKTKNFSLMGATDDDYAVILPFVLSRGKAKNVIIGIDFFSFARRRGAVNKYLYDDNRLNDYEYLWNYTSLKNAIKYALDKIPEKNLYHFNSPVGRKPLSNSYNSVITAGGYEGEIFDAESMIIRYNESLLPTIAGSSDSIKWHIYFPPYSIGEFMIYDKYGDLDACLELKSHIISTLKNLPNVELYDFQVSPWIDNLDQYQDVRHHSHEYNRAIMESIHAGRFRIHDYDENYPDNLRLMIKQYADSLIL